MVSGFVSIIGRPNAGKSTLLNALVGEKLAIVTPKPQTTRTRIQGILNVKAGKERPAAQIVFIDTPGVHRPDSRLNRKMLQEIHEALESRDLVLLIVDASEKFGPGDQQALELIMQHMGERLVTRPDVGQRPSSAANRVFLLLNKIDKIPKQNLLPLMEEWNRRHEFQEIIPVSAKTGAGLDVLLDKIIQALPRGPRYFPEDQVTDQPERFLSAEIIREQILRKTGKEVPYSIAVMVERLEELEKLIRIAATIYCEREGQKGIIIGKRGEHLKEIGTAARLEMERLLGKKVFLELHVKVKPGWRDSQAFVEELDWRAER
ncbi:MAG TPA: GTPase Era [Candidatus Angelobacter sp.]|nr:GTPase Era [Candidatus Angelobacter sp.]